MKEVTTINNNSSPPYSIVWGHFAASKPGPLSVIVVKINSAEKN